MAELSLRQLQEEVRPWTEHNFGHRPSWQPLLGLMEELGELSHAHLKGEQKIRTNEDHLASAQDAVGDLIIYLADYCNLRGFDMQTILQATWEKVMKRDWIASPGTGDTP